MKLLGTLTKSAIAAKVINEARKPHNQAKIKRFIGNLTTKRAAHR